MRALPLGTVVLLAGVAISSTGCRRDSACDNAQAGTSEKGPEGRTAPQPESRDERLERQVRTKLFGDPQLTGGGSIAVIVEGARVRLEGWVDSVNERTLAEVDAATVAGVVTVDNRLLVRGAGAGRLTR
jgi:osmotically-inducible protein OsmY